jgi:hypothetical protein
VIQFDADGQHPANSLPRILNLLDEHEWVIGSRHKTGSYSSRRTKLAQKCLQHVVLKYHKLHCTDISSGLWGMTFKTVVQLKQYKGTTADAAIRTFGYNRGIQLFEIPVPMMDRKTGKSMHDGFSSLVNYLRTFRDIYSHSSADTIAESKSASLSM